MIGRRWPVASKQGGRRRRSAGQGKLVGGVWRLVCGNHRRWRLVKESRDRSLIKEKKQPSSQREVEETGLDQPRSKPRPDASSSKPIDMDLFLLTSRPLPPIDNNNSQVVRPSARHRDGTTNGGKTDLGAARQGASPLLCDSTGPKPYVVFFLPGPGSVPSAMT